MILRQYIKKRGSILLFTAFVFGLFIVPTLKAHAFTRGTLVGYDDLTFTLPGSGTMFPDSLEWNTACLAGGSVGSGKTSIALPFSSNLASFTTLTSGSDLTAKTNCSGGTGTTTLGGSWGINQIVWHWTAGVLDTGTFTYSNTNTRIISVAPTLGSTTATTSVNLSASYFLDPAQKATLTCNTFHFNDAGLGVTDCDYKLTYNIQNYDRTDLPVFHQDYNITIDGEPTGIIASRDSTVNLPIGFYRGFWQIYYNGTAIVSTSTAFTVVSTNLSATTTRALTGTSTHNVSSESECIGLDFFTFSCMRSLVTLTDEQTSDLNDQLTVAFFGKVPFSYIVRTNQLLQASTTVALPALDFTFASTAPAFFSGLNINFNPWVYGSDSSTSPLNTMVDPTSGKNTYQVLLPLINLFVYMVLVMKIINDLTHIHVDEKHNI